MKIIVFALSGLGDAIMFMPALSALEQSEHVVEIVVLTMFAPVKDILKHCSKKTTPIVWNFLKENPFKSLSFFFSLRKRKFDYSFVVFPANRYHYNIISFIVGANKRYGHRYLHDNIKSLHYLNNNVILENNNLHNVEENIILVESAGFNCNLRKVLYHNFSTTPSDVVEQWLKTHNSDNRILIGIHAGSAVLKNQMNKRWSKAKFAELAIKLSEHFNARLCLFGGPEENDLNDWISEHSNAISIKFKKFSDSMSLMNHCRLFVSNDSGLMHTASLLNIPTVAIFGYTDPNHTKPWFNHSIVVRKNMNCSPCFYFSPKPAHCKEYQGDESFKCIKDITVEEVFQACCSLMK